MSEKDWTIFGALVLGFNSAVAMFLLTHSALVMVTTGLVVFMLSFWWMAWMEGLMPHAEL